MTVEELKAATSDCTRGEKVSVMNERTVARIIIDLDTNVLSLWLRDESEKGWLDYPLDFVKK
jgi:hypothetical protein